MCALPSDTASEDSGTKLRHWAIDTVVGLVIGGIAGVVVAWNLAIFLGVPEGYEAGISEVFDHSLLVGVLWLAALICLPVAGIIIARKRRHKRERSVGSTR